MCSAKQQYYYQVIYNAALWLAVYAGFCSATRDGEALLDSVENI